MKAAVMTGRALVALLSAAVLAVAGYGWATVQRVQESVNTTDVLVELSDVPNAPPAEDGATDVLLVGSDSRTDARGVTLPDHVLKELRTEATDTVNTDTIIILRVPKHGGKAQAISIPRDTYVPVPGRGEMKINSAYGVTRYHKMLELQAQGVHDVAERARQGDQAGRRALVQVLQDLTGVRVDHYAEVNLYGFYLLTDVIGGVEVCLKQATYDKDSGADFPAGVQSISGADALAFVRQRKGIPNGDLGRIARQQVFLSAAVSKLMSAGTLADPARLSGLLDAVRQSVVVDEGFDLATLAAQARGLAGGNVSFATIPVTGVGVHVEHAGSVITVDPAQVKAFAAQVLGEKKTTPPVTTTRGFAGSRPVSLDGRARVGRQGPPCID